MSKIAESSHKPNELFRNAHNLDEGSLVDQQEPGFPRIELMNLVADAVKGIDRLNCLTEVRMTGEGPNYKVILHASEEY